MIGNTPGNKCPNEFEDGRINETFIFTQCNADLNGTESSLQDCMIKTVDSCPCDKTARLQCQQGDARGINPDL